MNLQTSSDTIHSTWPQGTFAIALSWSWCQNMICWNVFAYWQSLLVGGFNPIPKILVKLDHFLIFRGENKKYLKPPPRLSFSNSFHIKFQPHFQHSARCKLMGYSCFSRIQLESHWKLHKESPILPKKWKKGFSNEVSQFIFSNFPLLGEEQIINTPS